MHAKLAVLALATGAQAQLLGGLLGGGSRPEAIVPGQCTGQTCYLASLSTSTEEPYKLVDGKKPTGGDAAGDRCIKEYYSKLGLSPPEGLKRFKRNALGLDSIDFPQDDAETIAEYLRAEKRQLLSGLFSGRQSGGSGAGSSGAACKANAVIFGKGTTERGDIGSTVGPVLKRALGNSWDFIGVNYDASLAGIKCNGMPGGYIAKGIVNDLGRRCPSTNIILSGYSQGAMVARFAAAWADAAVKPQIKGVLLFGDPFNGATVKGIPQSKIKTFCNDGDGVCRGALDIKLDHLLYASDGSVPKGAAWAKQQVA